MLRAALALAAGAMLLALTACGAPGEDALDELREDMTAADGVTVRAAVTSTAGGEYAEYELECTRSGGEYGVTVLAPAEVAGVTATLDLDGGTLGYDGLALAFASPGGVTPITALPELLRALESAYAALSWTEGESTFVSLEVTDSLTMTVELGRDGSPVWAELLEDGTASAQCEISQFTID